MPENRFYFPTPFQLQQTLTLSGDEHKHLRVMRKREGDTVEVVNGQHQLAICTITHTDRSLSTLTVDQIEEKSPPRTLILAQALLRPKNLDLVIEKGTELGATAFWLFPSENSEKKDLSQSQLQRLHHLTIAALKQCGRLDLPQIELHPPLLHWEHFPSDSIYGDPQAEELITETSCIFIGPERGFSPKEEHLLQKQSKAVRLHTNTLRAETAALCALSQAALLVS